MAVPPVATPTEHACSGSAVVAMTGFCRTLFVCSRRMSEPEVCRLIYNEARAAVDRQFSEVEEVRGAGARGLGVASLAAADRGPLEVGC